ncbi:amino acid permease-domain-containing protein [Podospora australis]|uniref:Amino acid permease-domain-containing protein n=1 Tax=Podospora australis TaxID=1536484 RepID=A0AAN7AP06_9PEZI|nr:amino acid permease-domain-containing protein [Podospora australis]
MAERTALHDPAAAERRPLLSTTTSRDGHNGPRQVEEERDVGAAASGTFKRNLGTIEAFAIVISIVIGSGVFTSPGSIDTNVPSPGAALLIWLVGGVLAWTGASTMAELGTAIPGEGGVQPYLKYIFGDVFGFLAAWTWVVAIMPATLAILSIVFIESIYSAAGVTGQGDKISHKLLSILVLVLISLANSISTKASTRLNNFFVGTKFVTIALIVLAGIIVAILQVAQPDRDIGGGDWYKKSWFGYRDSVNPDGSLTHWGGLSQWELFGHLSAALYAALWAYSGWDKAIYVSAELSAPAKQLPRAINTSIPTIIVCFITANAAYYILLPWDVVSTTDSVAVTAITRLLGSAFGIIAAVFICLVVAGSLLGNSFVAGRMAVAAANQNWLPSLFSIVGRVGSKTQNPEQTAPESDAPINAIILSTVLSALYILFGSFRALLTFNGLGEYTFFFLTVLGAILLRHREPELPRPYKPFVAIPIIFALVSGFVVVRGGFFAPVQTIILIGLWTLGLAFYWIRGRYLERGLEGITNNITNTMPPMKLSPLPKLPAGAAYIKLTNHAKRNALSTEVLKSLKSQLIQINTPAHRKQPLLLPQFQPYVLDQLEATYERLMSAHRPMSTFGNGNGPDSNDKTWLISAEVFAQERKHLPSVIVIASEAPVFSSGHDIGEVRFGTWDDTKELFQLCGEVMSLIRRSPALVISRVVGTASGAGCQLALGTDIPIASRQLSRFELPGADLGFPCTTPAAGLSRMLGNKKTFLELAKGGVMRQQAWEDGVLLAEDAEDNETALKNIDEVLVRTVTAALGRSAQQTALAKWAFWTQAAFKGRGGQRSRDDQDEDELGYGGGGGDGYEDALVFAGRIMALHAQSSDAKKGLDAFLNRKKAINEGAEGGRENASDGSKMESSG